jgi:hypothetical protein
VGPGRLWAERDYDTRLDELGSGEVRVDQSTAPSWSEVRLRIEGAEHCDELTRLVAGGEAALKQQLEGGDAVALLRKVRPNRHLAATTLLTRPCSASSAGSITRAAFRWLAPSA